MNEMFSKQNIKTGLVFGVPVAIISFLGFIPFIGWFLGIFTWLILLCGGYVVIMIKGGSKEKLSEVITNSIMAAIPAAGVIIIGIVLSSVISALLYNSWFTFIVGTIVSIVASVIETTVLFVAGSIFAVYFPEDKLAPGLRDLFVKAKEFILN
jgi:hypothetical protein